MAKLAKATNTEEKVEVTVDTTVTPEVEAPEEIETPDVEEDTTDEGVEVKEEEEEEVPEEKDEVKVEVDTSPVDLASQATEKLVRIRMRENHRCVVGSEVYDLKKDSCYNVPNDIKLKLNKAGLLSPL